MKTKNKLFALLSVILPLAITGCDNDAPSTIEIPEMTISENEIKVKIGNDVNVDVIPGGGEYKVFSLNEEIAKAQLANNKLTVQGITIGKTSLIISDNDNCYERLAVMVYQYDAIKVEQQEVALKFPLGNPKQATINILEGNGNYTISSDNKVVEASVIGSIITIKAIGKNGVANLTVTDASGFQAFIRVQAEASMIPYDEAELEDIKTDQTLRYVFDGEVKKNASTSSSLLNKKEGDLNLYGWDYYNYHLKIYFAGDKEIGEKSESKLTQKNSSSSFSNEPIKFEIIKNDGTKIWATYSVVKGEKLYFGHFCQQINP